MHHVDLNKVWLSAGNHESREDGTCLMEAVSWWAGEEHTSSPACVSPVLRWVGIALNDALPDEPRQRLRPLIPDLAGTAGDDLDHIRGWIAADWVIRTWAPEWLDLAGLGQDAASLRALSPVTSTWEARCARPTVRLVHAHSYDLSIDAAENAYRKGRPRPAVRLLWAAADEIGAPAWDATRTPESGARSEGDQGALRDAWSAARLATEAAACQIAIREPASVEAAMAAACAPVLERLQDSASRLFTRMIRI